MALSSDEIEELVEQADQSDPEACAKLGSRKPR